MQTIHLTPDLVAHPPTETVAALVLLHQDRVLLQRHPKDADCYASMWDLPLVHVTDGQTAEEALRGATRASLGIEVLGFHLLGARDDLRVAADAGTGVEPVARCCRRFVYRLTRYEGEPKAAEMQRWFARAEFADVFQLNPIVEATPIFD